ncbi:MAG: ADP-ribosylglycohydrolase family protein [Clostridiales bacterium]|jgi:hypothetical protein|nr:ADP-ribosylglycohydrolase family protein [Clostridiales bacterium]
MKVTKKIFLGLLSVIMSVVSGCTGGTPVQPEPPEDEPVYETVTPASGDRVISMAEYVDKMKGGFVGTMVGVSYGSTYEFRYRGWKWPTSSWKADDIKDSFNQDDIYLSLGALEALENYGIDVTSRVAGIELYNKNYEYWDGSNNNVLIAGWAPPFSGYPKRDNITTQPWPDSCSYMCGGAYGGLLSPGALKQADYLAEKFAEIVCYGDGIYGTQFVAAMFAEAFFETDVMRVIEAGLSAIPADSWTKLCVEDVIANYNDGMSAEDNCTAIHTKWVEDSYYNWTVWPKGVYPGDGILLDAKACAAFIAIGLLYGDKDIETSAKYTIACGSDTDSNAAQTAGILAVMNGGYSQMETKYYAGINQSYKFKYGPYTFDGAVEAYERVVKENVKALGGKVGLVDGVLSLVIPAAAQPATPGAYQNSKTPAPMEMAVYTDGEMAQLRTIKDPGFEMQSNGSALEYAWASTTPSKLTMVRYSEDTHNGIVNARIANDSADIFADIYKLADVERNGDYVYSCWVKSVGALSADAIKLSVETTDGQSVIRSKTYGAQGQWTRLELTFNSGANSGLRIRVGFNGGSGQVLLLDDFGLFLA